jgi:hypothetical protein
MHVYPSHCFAILQAAGELLKTRVLEKGENADSAWPGLCPQLDTKRYSLIIDLDHSLGKSQLLDDLAIAKVQDVHTLASLQLAFVARGRGGPFQPPSQQGTLSRFIDKDILLDKAKPTVIRKPGRPGPTERPFASDSRPGPVLKDDLIVKQVHHAIEVVLVPNV